MEGNKIDKTLELVKEAFKQAQNTNTKEYERLIRLIDKRKRKK